MKDFFQMSRDLAYLHSAYSVIYWDFETSLPKGGAEWCAGTLGHLTGMLHEKTIDKDYLNAAEVAHAQAKDPVIKEGLAQAIKDIKRASQVPQTLAEELSRAQALTHEVWVEARKKKDFSHFAPHLEKMIELTKKKAKCLAGEGSGYDALLDLYSPGMTAATIGKLFTELRPKLQALITKRRKGLGRTWSVPVNVQEKICHDVVEWMGFPRENLVQARSVHPFCLSLHPTDVRLTTRYSEDDPLMSLFSTIHELGHGLYEHQLPQDYPGTPLMLANGMDLHESQSRLWEVCLATSREFYRWVHRWFTANAPEHIKGWSAEELFLLGSEVRPSLIRTESDPVTYGMHIMIRFEIETAIFENRLSVQDIPRAWNEAYERYLGIKPADDGEGVLQDSHWASGSFGYFPSYLLGTMVSCQLYETLLRTFPDLSTRVENGNMKEIREWLKSSVHRYGRGMKMTEILKRATGDELQVKPFLDFLEERFIQ